MHVEYLPHVGADTVQRELYELAQAGGDRLVGGVPVRAAGFYRGQRSKPGLYWMASLGRHVSYESEFERDFLIGADFDGDVVQVLPQPFRLHFGRDAAPFRHTPDFLVQRSHDGLEVVDVKGAHALQKPAVRVAFELTEHACRVLGWAFTVYTEPDPVMRSNLSLLGGFRSPLCQPLDGYAPALVQMVDKSSLPARQVAEQLAATEGLALPVAVAAMWRAVWMRVLHIDDLRHPLELRTRLWAIKPETPLHGRECA